MPDLLPGEPGAPLLRDGLLPGELSAPSLYVGLLPGEPAALPAKVVQCGENPTRVEKT